MAAQPLQINLLWTLIRVRAFGERVRYLFAAGRLPGFVHLSIGQEAVAAGARATEGHGRFLPRRRLRLSSRARAR